MKTCDTAGVKMSESQLCKPVFNASVIAVNSIGITPNDILVLIQKYIMTDKKLINSPDTCVDECLYGLCISHIHLILHSEERVVYDGVCIYF